MGINFARAAAFRLLLSMIFGCQGFFDGQPVSCLSFFYLLEVKGGKKKCIKSNFDPESECLLVNNKQNHIQVESFCDIPSNITGAFLLRFTSLVLRCIHVKELCFIAATIQLNSGTSAIVQCGP